MSAKLEEIKAELVELSEADLVVLQAQIMEILRLKKDSNGVKPSEEAPIRGIRLPHAYRPNREEIEASIRARYTPEELEQIRAVDLTKLRPWHKTVTEYLNEDREDRF